MSLISEEEALSYLKANDHRFTNSGGVVLLISDEMVSTHLSFYYPEDKDLCEFYICTEEESLAEFIKGFKIQTTDDIENLGYNDSWIRYLNGYAEIGMTITELEATISFMLFKLRTRVFSLDLHFYDEVYEHLTLREDFLNYYHKNEHRLQAAEANRYKL